MDGLVVWFVGHFVGDILLQNRKIAEMKGKSLLVLCAHSAIVSLAVGLFAGRLDLLPWAFGTHFAIDRLALGKEVWPRLIGQGEPGTDAPPPRWLGIFDDQILHLVSLFLIFKLLG